MAVETTETQMPTLTLATKASISAWLPAMLAYHWS